MSSTASGARPLPWLGTWFRGRYEGVPSGSREVLVALDSTPHGAKPEGREVAAISRRVESPRAARRVPLSEVARVLSVGGTALPGIHGGGRRKGNWRAQQLWFLDVDNDAPLYPPLGMLEACERARRSIGTAPAIMYQSYSAPGAGGAGPERFRLVFALPEPTERPGEAEAFGRRLLATYPEADQSTVQGNRLFYGTRWEVYVNE